MNSAVSPGSSEMDAAVSGALQCVEIEAEAVTNLSTSLASDLPPVLSLITSSRGRVIVGGLGKSGHIGRKIAATLASTGTPAFFVHAGEALHGDAGMATPEDVVILISNSGETTEVCDFGRQVSARGIPIVAMTGGRRSTLASIADLVIDIGVAREADPLNLAPTASTTVTLVAGDALAAALMVLGGTTESDFALHHPAGALGRKLLADREGGR